MDINKIAGRISASETQSEDLNKTTKEIVPSKSAENNFLNNDAIEVPSTSAFEEIVSSAEPLLYGTQDNPADRSPYIKVIQNGGNLAIDGGALSVLNAPGQTNWDAIRLLKEELAKSDPDGMAMIDSLENLSPADRAETLKTLATAAQGTSDYEEIIMAISKDPAAFKKVAPFLHDVSIQAGDDPGLLKILGQTFDAIDRLPMDAGGASVLADYMGSMVGREDILRKLDADSLAKLSSNLLAPMTQTNMFHDLWGGDNSLTAAFFGMKVLQMWGENVGLGSKIADAVQQQGWKDIVSAVSQYSSWGQPDPHFAEALQNFPDLTQKLLGDLTEDQISSAFGALAAENQDFSATLAGLAQTGTDYPLSTMLRAIAQDGGAFGDDLIRNMISRLGSNAAESLSKLNTLLLLDMQIILGNGDEQDLDSATQKILEQAISLQQ